MAKKWTKLLQINTSNSVTDEYGYVFLAEDLTQGEMDWDETEELQIKKLPLKQALEMVMENRITDSLSIAGILKAAKVFGL
ncbi:MAG: DNA mismatch repair protein MutT, partial [Cyclobacteriaceae bacterium]|nr:DNA mismatch repair protein MutT [Cyclobacteriaceae bacterium]